MKKLCFVCLGNICRSPMAEFIMKDLAGDRLWVESRGTSDWEHGNPIHSGTQRKLREKGIAFDQAKTSQQLTKSDLADFDVILALDEQNLADILDLSGGQFDQKIFLLGNKGVPDPWYSGDFQETYELVTAACRRWLDKIEEM